MINVFFFNHFISLTYETPNGVRYVSCQPVMASVANDELTPNGEAQVISAKDYYPFGMSMPSRTTEGGTYRYGFNGQERDTELGESVYTAEFWQYSANLGRRWNVDPITFPNISPYATFNDNPISENDPTGAAPEKVVPDDNDESKKIYEEYKNLITKSIEQLKKDKKENTFEYQQLKQIEKEFDILEKSPFVFRIKAGKEIQKTLNGTSGGHSTYNAETGELDVSVGKANEIANRIQILSHELKHAYQFTQRQISYTMTGDCRVYPSAETYDLGDEFEAYQRHNFIGLICNSRDAIILTKGEQEAHIRRAYNTLGEQRLNVTDSVIAMYDDRYKRQCKRLQESPNGAKYVKALTVLIYHPPTQ